MEGVGGHIGFTLLVLWVINTLIHTLAHVILNDSRGWSATLMVLSRLNPKSEFPHSQQL